MRCDALGVDVVLIAHGDLGDQLASERSFDQAHATLRTNFLSVVSLLIPLANRMEAGGAASGSSRRSPAIAAAQGTAYGAAKGGSVSTSGTRRAPLAAPAVSVTT